jgi:AcrR family transcriptional regulator
VTQPQRADETTDRRVRSRRGEGERLREDILTAVNQLLDEQGGDANLTMRAVAKRAGVAAPSIYLHFTDKAELVWAALTDKYEHVAAQMAAAAELDNGDPRQQLVAQAHAYCRFGLENPGHYRLMFEVRQPAVERSRLGTHPARLIAGRFRTALGECADHGYPLAFAVHQAAHTLLSGLHGMVSLQHCLAPGRPDSDVVALQLALADGIVDSLVGSKRVRGRTRPEPTRADRTIASTVQH